jgi:hypothetical protein
MPVQRAPKPFASLPLVVLALGALLAQGCASPVKQQKGRADLAMKDFRLSLDTFDDRIESSVRAIDRLQSPSTFDTPRAYQDFTAEYFNVSADANDVSQRAEEMRDTGTDYFVMARKEAKADNNAKAADDLVRQEAAVREAYDLLQARLGELTEAYRVYKLQLGGIHKYLSRDASRQRIATGAQLLLNAREQAGVVRKAIAATTEQSDELAAVAGVKK